jgi:hypothetical protein
MARESSEHQAYIVNMMEHGGRMVLSMERLNTCKTEQEVIKEMKISYLVTYSWYKDNN